MIKMDFIDYNMWCSIMEFLEDKLPEELYGVDGISNNIPVVPSYPKHLTKFSKPCVIVQKIYGTSETIGIGGVLGQYEDEYLQTYDVSGRLHSAIYQLTVEGNDNFQSSILTSAIASILQTSTEEDSNATRLPLKDHTKKLRPVIGNIARYGNIELTPLSVDEDEDYAVSIRATFSVVQSIIDTDQQFVDLRKPIKWVIKLNTGRE